MLALSVARLIILSPICACGDAHAESASEIYSALRLLSSNAGNDTSASNSSEIANVTSTPTPTPTQAPTSPPTPAPSAKPSDDPTSIGNRHNVTNLTNNTNRTHETLPSSAPTPTEVFDGSTRIGSNSSSTAVANNATNASNTSRPGDESDPSNACSTFNSSNACKNANGSSANGTGNASSFSNASNTSNDSIAITSAPTAAPTILNDTVPTPAPTLSAMDQLTDAPTALPPGVSFVPTPTPTKQPTELSPIVISFAITVQNISYAGLVANDALADSFKAALQEVVVAEANGNFLTPDVAVQLSPGTVVANVDISLPPEALQPDIIVTTLTRKNLSRVALNRWNELDLNGVQIGPLRISRITYPLITGVTARPTSSPTPAPPTPAPAVFDGTITLRITPEKLLLLEEHLITNTHAFREAMLVAVATISACDINLAMNISLHGAGGLDAFPWNTGWPEAHNIPLWPDCIAPSQDPSLSRAYLAQVAEGWDPPSLVVLRDERLRGVDMVPNVTLTGITVAERSRYRRLQKVPVHLTGNVNTRYSISVFAETSEIVAANLVMVPTNTTGLVIAAALARHQVSEDISVAVTRHTSSAKSLYEDYASCAFRSAAPAAVEWTHAVFKMLDAFFR